MWSKPEEADAKFLEWAGAHGQPGTGLTLTATIGGQTRPVKSWTHEGGPQVVRAAC
ncbi:hypothetical protein ACH4A8_20055 [Streptomyces vietnamensis]|uniref:hypothetical protein n=1 Tax=Streptomyces vietnamensis TaxID=362257 RepID=UPI0037B838A0